MWRATVLTLYPELFPGPLGRLRSWDAGRAEGLWGLETVNIRDFSDNQYGSVDDTPAGGGAGLVMRADILASAIDSAVPRNDRPVPLPFAPRRAPDAGPRSVSSLRRGPASSPCAVGLKGLDERIFEAAARRRGLHRRFRPRRGRNRRHGPDRGLRPPHLRGIGLRFISWGRKL